MGALFALFLAVLAVVYFSLAGVAQWIEWYIRLGLAFVVALIAFAFAALGAWIA